MWVLPLQVPRVNGADGVVRPYKVRARKMRSLDKTLHFHAACVTIFI